MYYEGQKAGLGLDLLSEVEQAIGKIQQNPSIGALYKIAELRRYVMESVDQIIGGNDRLNDALEGKK
ncbi:hypothetical protein LC612_05605 [Nostoc sp. CHAB 5834]|nr:hypothetical protein [Nostoc sp. CHAB 5834]